jgi:hypothetical protein
MDGGDDADESEDDLDGDGVDSDSEAVDKGGGDSNLRGNDEGEGLEEPGTGDVNDEGRSGDEEEDYGYIYGTDEDSDSNDDEPLDVADDALGPEDGEGDVDEVDLLGFASF